MKIADYSKVKALGQENVLLLDGPDGTKTILAPDVSSQVKWAKFRHKVYQCRGEVSPGSIPAEKVSL